MRMRSVNVVGAAVCLKRDSRGQCQIVSTGEVRIGPNSLIGNMSDETAVEEQGTLISSNQQQQLLQKNSSKILSAKVHTSLSDGQGTTGGNSSNCQEDPGDIVVIGRDSRERRAIEAGSKEGSSDLTSQQIHCIVTSSQNINTGNHLHGVVRSSAGTEDVEEEIEECCVVGGTEEGNEVITDESAGILSAVVSKHLPITVTGVSLADIQADHETLIEVDPLQQHHHVTHHPGGSVSVNMGNHHHHDDSTGNTIITIPVGSLTPYTVITNAETNGAGTIAVSLAQEMQQQHHLVQQSITTTSGQAQAQCNSHLTWEEAVSAPVLPIRCKDTNAELHKSKFGSGNKGKCIKLGLEWFTPTEFEALCGRGNSKDWKRSIRFGGRTLQTLIDKGFLIPHASSCICSNCVDDATATGPIRPFTPYQRKRKGQATDNMKIKLERLTSKDSNTDESSDLGTLGTPLSLGPGLNPLTQALMKISQISLPACTQEAWKLVEDAVDGIVRASATVKSLVLELKERSNQEASDLRSQIQNSVQTTLVQNPIVGQPQILRIFDSNRIQTYSIEVLDPDSFKPLPTNTCENCGREGTLECSGCHVVHYCSSFCQKKDWPNHQTVCADRRHTECKPEPQT